MRLAALAVASVALRCVDAASIEYSETVVVGAGPGGIQMAYYLQKAGRDYTILERNGVAGSFYVRNPRHRQLISINKFNTGSGNAEFNLRHDWNSLLDDEGFRFPQRYSSDFFPNADSLVDYLGDFAAHYSLNIEYNTEVTLVEKDVAGTGYSLTTKVGNGTEVLQRKCKYLIIATGIAVSRIPTFRGIEFTTPYSEMSVDPEDYRNSSVLILGRGNAAFETADNLTSVVSHLHMVGRSKQRFAWQTHYVGDLRAVNNNALDTYQLKSMTGIADTFDFASETLAEQAYFTKEDDGLIYFKRCSGSFCGLPDTTLRIGYKHVINCLGWKQDDTIFAKDVAPETIKMGKYPKLTEMYESITAPNMFFTGTIAHGKEHKKSSGGFIHGFRYMVRFLFNAMEHREHKTTWPGSTYALPLSTPKDAAGAFVDVLIPRVNEASGMYQMFHWLHDLYIVDFKNQQLHQFRELTGEYIPTFLGLEYGNTKPLNFITVGFEFGPHGEDIDTFRSDRANPEDGEKSSFLHPVLRYYSIDAGEVVDMESPKSMFHIPEDFVTEWHSRQEVVPTVGELAKMWAKQGLKGVPPGGFEQLLDSYRHPIHIDPLIEFLTKALLGTYACEARHEA